MSGVCHLSRWTAKGPPMLGGGDWRSSLGGLVDLVDDGALVRGCTGLLRLQENASP